MLFNRRFFRSNDSYLHTIIQRKEKKTIGKFTVVVRQATVYKVDNITIPPGKYTSTFGLDSISYRRESAKYVFTCDKPGLNIIDKDTNRIDNLDNPYVDNIQVCEATPGQYKVTLKEIYKKKQELLQHVLLQYQRPHLKQ